MAKVLAAMGVPLPSAIGTAMLFAINAPMKEFIIHAAFFASYTTYRKFSKAIEAKYSQKILYI